MQCGATTEGLCALHGSSASQVTRSADGRDMIEAASPTICWDGRPDQKTTAHMPEKTQTLDELVAPVTNGTQTLVELLATVPNLFLRCAIRRRFAVPKLPLPPAPVIPSAAELNSKNHNIQTLRQLCDAHHLDSDGRRYALVARLNQRRDYRAWSEIVGDWRTGCTLSDAELKNATKHSTENLRQRCKEINLYNWLGQHSDDSRHALVARLIKHRAWHNAMQAKIRPRETTTPGNLNQPPAPMQCGATTEGLCALHGSSASQVTRSADGRDMIEATSQPIGRDPGRPKGLHHLLTHPTTPRNDATTTENIRFPIPPPNPCASMRAQEDEVKAALGRPPITGGWDPGRPNEPPLLLLHPPHDATATENVSVPSLPLNPRAPWRALEDKNTAALGCLLITGGWDPGRTNASPPLPPHDATTTENVRVPILPLNPRAPWRAPEVRDNAALGCLSIAGGWDPGRTTVSPPLSPHDATTTENVRVLILPLNPRAPWRAPEDQDNAALGCLSITGGWDPGRSNASPLLLMHPPHLPLLRNDTTTTENITAHDRSPIVICGWDPGKDDDEDSLSDCETALACDDGSTFADDFAVAGGISGNGVPTPPGTTPTTARAFADPGTGHDDDAVCDDDEAPD